MGDFGILAVKVIEFRFGVTANDFLQPATTRLADIPLIAAFQMRLARIRGTIHLLGLHYDR